MSETETPTDPPKVTETEPPKADPPVTPPADPPAPPAAPQSSNDMPDWAKSLTETVSGLTNTVAAIVEKGQPIDQTPTKKPWTHWGSK